MSQRRNRERVYLTRDPEVAAEQAVGIAKTFGCVRVVTNDSIAARRAAHRDGLPFPSYEALAKLLITDAKLTQERAWLGEVSAVPLQSALRDATQAYRNFFDSLSGKRKGRRMGLPRFKKRSARQSARFTRNARFKIRKVSQGAYLLRLPGIAGELRIKCSRPIPDDPSSVTLIRESDGRLYASFCHEVTDEDPAAAALDTSAAVGIDLGSVTLTAETRVHPEAVTPDDQVSRYKEPNPKHLSRNVKKLARQQRALARKQKGSNNYTKQRVKVAATHRKVRETRLHAHRQVARRLCHENQVIAHETLSVFGLCRSGPKGVRGRGIRRAYHDVAWGLFLRELTRYAHEYGRTVIPIDRWEPTSQVCPVCGCKDGPKPVDVRVWQCQACDVWLDRDWAAAVNVLLAAGLAERINACGEDVRLRLAEADPETPRQWEESGTSGNPRGSTTPATA